MSRHAIHIKSRNRLRYTRYEHSKSWTQDQHIADIVFELGDISPKH
jgi:hypothetical protein